MTEDNDSKIEHTELLDDMSSIGRGDWSWRPGLYGCKPPRDSKGGYGWTLPNYPNLKASDARPARIGPRI